MRRRKTRRVHESESEDENEELSAGGVGSSSTSQLQRAIEEAVRRKTEEVQSRLEPLDNEGLIGYLDAMEHKWNLDAHNRAMSTQAVYDMARVNFQLDDPAGGINTAALDLVQHVRVFIAEGATLYHCMYQKKMLNNGDLRSRVMRVNEVIAYANKMVLAMHRVAITIKSGAVAPGAEAALLQENRDIATGLNRAFFDFSPQAGAEGIKPVQNLILFLLNSAQMSNYRKYDNCCYQPIVTEGGFETHAWTRAETIEQFAYRVTCKEFNWDQWLNASEKQANMTSALKYISLAPDYQFPFLRKTRTCFAFK